MLKGKLMIGAIRSGRFLLLLSMEGVLQLLSFSLLAARAYIRVSVLYRTRALTRIVLLLQFGFLAS